MTKASGKIPGWPCLQEVMESLPLDLYVRDAQGQFLPFDAERAATLLASTPAPELPQQPDPAYTRAVLDNMFDGVITIDRNGIIESFNKAACTIFGYTREEVIGRNVSLLMPPAEAVQHDHHLMRHDQGHRTYLLGSPREMQGRRKDGSVFPINLAVSRIAYQGCTSFVGVIRDITLRKKQEEEIERLAFNDPLTELPNRRLLLDRLQQTIVGTMRSGLHAALMFLDLDHFKRLNDTLGHDVGDELLKQVATRLTLCVREGDTVARLGGDEFVVLLDGLGPPMLDAAAHCELVAHKILETLGQPYMLCGHPHAITPSIGIVVFQGEHDSTEDLLKKADVAMYQAKSTGRNGFRFFDPAMQASALAHAALEQELRQSLAASQFVLMYQFMVAADGTPRGAEALLRWQHERRGLVAPGAFLEQAEDSGLCHALGQWVLQAACQQLVQWAGSDATAHWSLAVNISARHFAQPDFVDQVSQVVHACGARPDLLRLELTEATLMQDVDRALQRMRSLHAMGVRFALDDFGTGYSSLLHLQRFPLDQLKIDRSFVTDLLTQGNDACVARSVVALGHALGLSVVAVGVETAAQRNALATMGCDMFQGYLFGQPLPAVALLAA